LHSCGVRPLAAKAEALQRANRVTAAVFVRESLQKSWH